MYGVIEGFYGPPWAHAERLSLLRFLGDEGLDTYVYAPKDDPRHRRRWAEPHDAAELTRFAELIQAAGDSDVGFTYALAPARILGGRGNLRARRRSLLRGGPAAVCIDPAQQAALHRKLRSLQELGCSRFALLFDDVAASFADALANAALGALHARAAADALAFLRAHDAAARLFLVPAVYKGKHGGWSAGAQAYWRTLGDVLGADVPVAWTGPAVWSPSIEPDDVQAIRDASGCEVVVWNNAVANDAAWLATGGALGRRGWRKLAFGPVDNLSAGLFDAVHGVLLNGCQEPRLCRLALATLSAARRAGPDARGGAQAWRAAAERLHGAAALAPLELLLDLTRALPFSGLDQEEATELRAASRAYREERDPAPLRCILERMRALPDQLAALDLADEVLPTARKAALLADAALAGLDGRPADCARLRREARAIKVFVARAAFDEVFRLLGAPADARAEPRES